MNIQNGAYLNGRLLRFFHHTSGEAEGYYTPQTDTFALLFPKNYNEGGEYPYPLEVVFHSAGHDVYTALDCLLTEGNHDIYHTPEDRFGLFLDCRANMNDWWWGGINAMGDGAPARCGVNPQPVERRCIATVEWVMENFPIDREYVYAVGNSMGGSGALGVCLPRGDIFAAIKVNVPAGVRHAADRCCLDTDVPEGFFIPDPPVVVDYSAQNDVWSTGHEVLYKSMREKRYAFHGYWGEFGHENNNVKIAEHNDLVHALPVMNIKLSDPYPVFTNTSTDDKNPWEFGESGDAAGQVNGYFRWESTSDREDGLELRLWLLTPSEWETRVTLPEEAVTDILIRRVKNFALDAGEEFFWTLTSDDGEALQGTSHADCTGHPVIDGITVRQKVQTLRLTRA